VAGTAKPVEGSLVDRMAMALDVRRARTTEVGPLLPSKPEPTQILNHRLVEFWSPPGSIQVVVAENQDAVSGAGPGLSEPESAGVAEV